MKTGTLRLFGIFLVGTALAAGSKLSAMQIVKEIREEGPAMAEEMGKP